MEFKKADLIFGNLEGPLSNRGKPLKNRCCLYSPPETIKSLKYVGSNITHFSKITIYLIMVMKVLKILLIF